jgi:hypothetical protein
VHRLLVFNETIRNFQKFSWRFTKLMPTNLA